MEARWKAVEVPKVPAPIIRIVGSEEGEDGEDIMMLFLEGVGLGLLGMNGG